MTAMIEATGVVKRFGKTTALDGLNLFAEQGSILAVLGPNGAGKTTFVRCIATLIKPDAGTLRLFGHDVAREAHAVRSSIGLAGQFAAVELAMTGRENLEMVARLFGQDRASARANSTRVLDEPTTGVDPRSRIDLWDAMRGLVERGTNVLLTTQYLDEADHLADQIVIIDHGRTIAQGTPAELKKRAGRKVVEVHVRAPEDVAEVASALATIGDGEAQIDESTRRVMVVVDGGWEQLGRALRPLEERGITLEDVALRPPRLDEVFLALTDGARSEGRAADADAPAMGLSLVPT